MTHARVMETSKADRTLRHKSRNTVGYAEWLKEEEPCFWAFVNDMSFDGRKMVTDGGHLAGNAGGARPRLLAQPESVLVQCERRRHQLDAQRWCPMRPSPVPVPYPTRNTAFRIPSGVCTAVADHLGQSRYRSGGEHLEWTRN